MNMTKCPICGSAGTYHTGLRGTNPNYWRENGFKCSNRDCGLSTSLVYQDYAPEHLKWLDETNRRSHIWKLVRG